MTTRSDLYRLIDELPEPALPAAAQRLAELQDPVLAALLSAPLDDEELTPEEEASIDAGLAAKARGDVVPWDEVQRRERAGA